jgi:hypothetical protein
MECFLSLLLLAGALFVLLSLVRWFEQITDAVDQRWWNKTTLLVLFPFASWFFPSRVSAGRPTAVPHHEPVRGFGIVPQRAETVEPTKVDGPPPGTPPEFIGLPKIPPKKKTSTAIDPEKLAKLKEKMKQQGMLNDE